MLEFNSNKDSEILNASVRDLRYIAALFRGINFGNRATFSVTKHGFIVNVEEARTLLATAYIFSDVFDEYVYNAEAAAAAKSSQARGASDSENESSTAFELPLNTLCECLNVFGNAGNMNSNVGNSKKTRKFRKVGEEVSDREEDREPRNAPTRHGVEFPGNGRIDNYFPSEGGTGLRISYSGSGYPLALLISDEKNGGPAAICEITTFEPEPQLELPFDANDTVLKIILKSSWLREALMELDPSCERLAIIGNPPPLDGHAPRPDAAPRLRLEAVGNFGSTEIDYPNDKEVLEACDCAQPVRFNYKFAHILKAAHALQASTKTSLRINEEGLLSLQFLMPPSKPGKTSGEAFIEYRCLALEDDGSAHTSKAIAQEIS